MNIKHLLLPPPISGTKGTKQGSGLGRTLCLAALFVTFATAAWADVEINSTNFPDGTFRKFVTDNFDTEKPKGSLSDAELQAVTTMDVSKKSIKNLKGIEYFTALTTLKCYANSLTRLDVSALTNLVTLECYNNSSDMTTLNATGCTALKTLKCYNSKLKALSLGSCKSLQTLDCHSNQLTALNVSACVQLNNFSCYGNSIRGDKMVEFINKLPLKARNTNLDLIYDENASSGNEIMHAQVLAAKGNKWTVRRKVSTSSWKEYAGIIAVDETTFPDPIFLEYVRWKEFDTNNDGILSESEVEEVTSIGPDGWKINDLTGIECFENLAYLNCLSNNLTSLDLSTNTKLKTLWCSYNKLTSLDLSKNTKLEVLLCSKNKLTSLDLSKNTALSELQCNNCELTELDLSANTQLRYLTCYQNHFQGEAADNFINKLPDREDSTPGVIYFYRQEPPGYNNLTSGQLDDIKAKNWNVKQYDGYYNDNDQWVDYVANHNGIYIDENAFPDETFRRYIKYKRDTDVDGYLNDEEVAALKEIDFTSRYDAYDYSSFESLQGIELLTQLEKLVVKDNSKVTSFDASVCPQLKTLSWTKGKLASLNASGCTELTSLNCSYNQLASLNVSGCIQLTELSCTSNSLESLDLTGCTQLTELSCSGNPLESLDLTDCPNLEKLSCYNTPLPSLDLSNRTSLKTLYCGGEGSALKTLNVSGCTSLDYLSLDPGDVLSSLNASGCTKLERLYCYRNQLTELIVSGCTQLKTLSCFENQLTSLDASGCTNLEYLSCNKNQLTELKFSGCTKLKELQCNENRLTELKVLGLSFLTSVNCKNNQLTSLEISDCESLQWFDCRENPLSTLKVTNCTTMYSIGFSDLPLTSLDLSGCTNLHYVNLPGSRLRGEAMDKLIKSLPVIETTDPDEMGYFNCINMHRSDEQSRITAAQAARLKEKGWRVWAYCDLYGGRSYEYDGHGPGDVDGNGIVDADDVNMTVSHILGLQGTGTDSRAQEEEAEAPEFFPIAADVTGDGEVDITDLTQIISKVGTVIYIKPEI